MIKQNVLLILLWHPVFIAITALATLHYDFKFAGLSLPRTTPAVTLTQCWSTADTFVTGFTDGGREGGAVEEDLCTCAWTNRDRWTTEWAVLWTDRHVDRGMSVPMQTFSPGRLAPVPTP